MLWGNGMRLGIIVSIFMVPICAQATFCEQFVTISDHLRKARNYANAEWNNRAALDKFRDWIALNKKPQAVLILENDQVTKELASHFDHMAQVDSDHVRLVRWENEERDAYERVGRFETINFEKLIPTHYALHLTAASDRPSYLQGRIVQIMEDGFDFLDAKSRTVYRVSRQEFVSAKAADIGDYFGKNKIEYKAGDPNALWEKSSTQDLREALRTKMDSAVQLLIQVKDGSSYGISGFHKLLVRQLSRLQFVDKGIFIPELNITVPSQDVVAVSAT